jgi:hypothetical protein
MNARSKLASIERRVNESLPVEAGDKRRSAIREWVDHRAGLRPTRLPAVLDGGSIPPPPHPAPPADVAPDLWADALDAVASFCKWVARTAAVGQFVPGASARAERLCYLHAGFAYYVLGFRPGDESVWFLPSDWFRPDPAPTNPVNPAEFAALRAVGVLWGRVPDYGDAMRIEELLANAAARSRST